MLCSDTDLNPVSGIGMEPDCQHVIRTRSDLKRNQSLCSDNPRLNHVFLSRAGKVSQVVFGFVDRTGVVANIVGGGIAEAGMFL